MDRELTGLCEPLSPSSVRTLLNPDIAAKCRDRAVQAVVKMTGWSRSDVEVALASRFVWRNGVFRVRHKAHAGSPDYCVKVFVRDCSSRKRLASEMLFGNPNDFGLTELSVPPILFADSCSDQDIDGVVVRPWIDGQSLMSDFRRDPAQSLRNSVPRVLRQMQVLWSLEWGKKTAAPSPACSLHLVTPRKRLGCFFGVSEISMIASLRERLPMFRDLLDAFWRRYRELRTEMSVESVVTHGDVSAHEWLFGRDAVWWIDWESAALQSAGVDMAGLYHSMGQSVVARPALRIGLLERILSCNRNIDQRKFGYYFAQRVMSTGWLCAEEMESLVLRWGFEEATKLMR